MSLTCLEELLTFVLYQKMFAFRIDTHLLDKAGALISRHQLLGDILLTFLVRPWGRQIYSINDFKKRFVVVQ